MADFKYVISDELAVVVFGPSDDAYWRILLGLNLCFGNTIKGKGF